MAETIEGATAFRAVTLDVLRFEGGGMVDGTTLHHRLGPPVGLPPTR